MITAAKAVINSVIQKLCHTPWAPITLLRIHARRSIMPIYLNMEIISELIPFPRASSAPDMVTGIEETINPMLIILIARIPIAIVSGLDEKIPISLSGAIRHSMVPRVMTMPIIEREQIKILRTRLCSPAP